MELPFSSPDMNNFYQSLFDHVAFPVFAVDKNGFVCYKNPASRKYHPRIRCRAKLQRHEKPSSCEHILILSDETPYPIGAKLFHGDITLCLFLSRFQHPDGKALIPKMIEHFGKSAEAFIPRLKSAATIAPAIRTYTELNLITEREILDLDIAPYDLETLVKPFFHKLRRFSALGYRIESTCEKSSGRYLARLSAHEFFHRLSHMLYLLMKISADKKIAIHLSTHEQKGCHQLSIQTVTAIAPAVYEGKSLLSLLPECEAEITLLSAFSTEKESPVLTIGEDGTAQLFYEIPCEKAAQILPLHSHMEFISPERRAEIFIRRLFKRFR